MDSGLEAIRRSSA